MSFALYLVQAAHSDLPAFSKKASSNTLPLMHRRLTGTHLVYSMVCSKLDCTVLQHSPWVTAQQSRISAQAEPMAQCLIYKKLSCLISICVTTRHLTNSSYSLRLQMWRLQHGADQNTLPICRCGKHIANLVFSAATWYNLSCSPMLDPGQHEVRQSGLNQSYQFFSSQQTKTYSQR